MARRDTAALAAKSFLYDNYQWSRFRHADSRTRGPGRGRSAVGEDVRVDEVEDTAEPRSAQWLAAERLFARIAS